MSAGHIKISQLRLYLFTNIWVCFYTEIEMDTGKRNVSGTREKIHSFYSTISKKKIGYFNYIDMFKIFDTMVTPVLCYAAEIWGYAYSEQI